MLVDQMLVDQMLDCKQCVKQCEFYVYIWDNAIRFEPSYNKCLDDMVFAISKKDGLRGYSYLIIEPVQNPSQTLKL